MVFPCVVVMLKGAEVSAFPFLVDATDETMAIGMAHKIGTKVLYPGYRFMGVQVGETVLITPETAELPPVDG